MKILEIHIYGYGKLENKVLTGLKDLNVFYGENEAGKSTIMSFIHSILFGFPTKQQSELRYEPKKSAKYGGQLVVLTEEKGKVIIERVKGRAAGDVSVLLEDGSTGGDELLNELISNIDKSLYQSIFSFNLHGLQNVHNLKNEDLGKFLFSTGTIGSERLLVVESELQKKIESLFKPNGKKPLINEKLQEVKAVYEELKKAEQQNDQYGKLLQEKEKLELEIEKNQLRVTEMQKKIRELEEWEKLAPVVKERDMLQGELEQNYVVFPVDGLSRLEQVQQLLKPLEAQRKTLIEQKERLQVELNESLPNVQLIEKETAIQRALERLPLYETIKVEESEWLAKRSHASAKIEEIKENLHFPIQEERLDQIDTSIFMKEKIAEAEKKQVRIKERKTELDEQFAREKEELERLEVQKELLKEDILPEAEREEKQQQLLKRSNKESIEKELRNTQDKIYLLQMNVKNERKQARQYQNQSLVLSIIFLLLSVWGLFQTQWLIAVVGGIGFAFMLFLIYQRKSNRNQDVEREIQELKAKELNLGHQLKNFDFAEINLIEEQLRRDAALQEQLAILQIKLEQQNTQYERVIQAFEEWEQKAISHRELLSELGKRLFIPEEIAQSKINEAFLLIVKLKDALREYQSIEMQLKKRLETKESIEKEISSLYQSFFDDEAIPVREQGFLLRDTLKKELIKQQKFEARVEKHQELIEQLELVEKEFVHLQKEQETLFQAAEVETEEEYRLAGKLSEKRAQMVARIEELSRQIDLSSLDKKVMKELSSIEPQAESLEVKAVLAQCLEASQKSHQALADVKHQIGLLEEGGVYGDLLHKYKQLQSELDIEAREWAKLSMAKEMLMKTVDRFKEERLPSMLQQAEEYLTFLTEGNYLRILPKKESNGFLIERKDHILFEANELSQATTEQVYVSIRLALATTIYKKYAFPIIIDDSFVNFDHKRTSKVIELLKTLKDNQILFFTCHQHLLKYFHETEVMEVGEGMTTNMI
ncbi:AAA family ATPase [Robertmurraya sp. Marseille-Q9965]